MPLAKFIILKTLNAIILPEIFWTNFQSLCSRSWQKPLVVACQSRLQAINSCDLWTFIPHNFIDSSEIREGCFYWKRCVAAVTVITELVSPEPDFLFCCIRCRSRFFVHLNHRSQIMVMIYGFSVGFMWIISLVRKFFFICQFCSGAEGHGYYLKKKCKILDGIFEASFWGIF